MSNVDLLVIFAKITQRAEGPLRSQGCVDQVLISESERTRGACVDAASLLPAAPLSMGWKVQVILKYWSSSSQLKKLKYAGTLKAFTTHVGNVCSQQVGCFLNWSRLKPREINGVRCSFAATHGHNWLTRVSWSSQGYLWLARGCRLLFSCVVVDSCCLAVRLDTHSIVVPIHTKSKERGSYFKSFTLKQSCARGGGVLTMKVWASDCVFT